MVDNEGRRTGDRVRLTKVATPPGGIIACPLGLYRPGLWAGILTLPLGYVLEGYLLADLIRGHPLRRGCSPVTGSQPVQSTRALEFYDCTIIVPSPATPFTWSRPLLTVALWWRQEDRDGERR